MTTYAAPRRRPGDLPALVRELRSTQDERSWPSPPPGDGRPAMLVPGLLAGDPSLARMARWLRRGRWRTVRPGIRRNVDCMEPAVAGLERRLEQAVAETGRRALVIGQSRGGTFGWALTVRRPDLVETLVTLGSPVLDQLAASRSTRATTYALAALGSLGVPGLFSMDCIDGPCCARSRGDLGSPLPTAVRGIAVYSRADAVVSWEACVPPGVQHVEVSGTHSGMGTSRVVWQHLADELAADPSPPPTSGPGPV